MLGVSGLLSSRSIFSTFIFQHIYFFEESKPIVL